MLSTFRRTPSNMALQAFVQILYLGEWKPMKIVGRGDVILEKEPNEKDVSCEL